MDEGSGYLEQNFSDGGKNSVFFVRKSLDKLKPTVVEISFTLYCNTSNKEWISLVIDHRGFVYRLSGTSEDSGEIKLFLTSVYEGIRWIKEGVDSNTKILLTIKSTNEYGINFIREWMTLFEKEEFDCPEKEMTHKVYEELNGINAEIKWISGVKDKVWDVCMGIENKTTECANTI